MTAPPNYKNQMQMIRKYSQLNVLMVILLKMVINMSMQVFNQDNNQLSFQAALLNNKARIKNVLDVIDTIILMKRMNVLNMLNLN